MASRPFLLTLMASAGLAAAGAAAAQTPVGPQPAPAYGAPRRGETPAAAPATVNDPWESTNRKLFGFNQALDRRVLRPGVVFYHHATPTPVRNGLHNVLTNMTEPVIIINNVLQLRPARAIRQFGRFAYNSTVGIGGVFDVATRSGLEYENADFGLTLARYGVRSGPYIFVPILGPTTVRDLVGRGVDSYVDPLNSINYDGRDVLAPTRTVLGGIDARDQVDALLKDVNRTATDPYATIRSAYLQNREAQVRGAPTSAASLQALPDFGPESPAPSPGPSSSGPSAAAPTPDDQPERPASPPPGPSAFLAEPSAPSADPVGDLLAAAPASPAPIETAAQAAPSSAGA